VPPVLTIDAVVVGEDGTPVRGLDASDFLVLDGGEPQPITSFEEVVVAPEAVASPVTEWMASTNQGPAGQPSRCFVIVYDAIHIGPTPVPRAKDAVSRLLREQTRPGDRVAAVAVGSGAWWSAPIPVGIDDLEAFVDGQRVSQ
jgi:hypothetical protein